ncbi:MAG: ornithine cyclodeaminase family protein [Gemmatimonadaceae bacterium]
MIILSQSDVERLLTMEACIEVMAATLTALARGDAVLPLRTIIRIPNTGDAFAVMPGYLGTPRSIGAKVITIYPNNHGTAFDSHQGAVLLFDPDNGSLSAILDATSITTTRTAAVSAVATRALSRPESSTLAIIGSGVQALAHLEAVCAVRPITTLHVWSRNAAHAEALAQIGRDRFHLDASASPSGEDAARGADIICCATSATTPVLFGEWVAPGTHVNAVGVSQPHAQELDMDVVVRSRLYVDRRESALKEAGDILQPLNAGLIGPNHIVAELGELLLDPSLGRRNQTEITLFKSLGLAVEDLATASHVLAEAERTGAGTRVELGGTRHASH